MAKVITFNTKKTTFLHYPADKVLSLLVTHVYQQTIIVMMAALFCGGVLFMGLWFTKNNPTMLYLWGIFFLAVIFTRIQLVKYYLRNKPYERGVRKWKNLYIVGSLLGGISWGLAGVLLFPNA